jgi:hypothetical protein
MNPADQIAIFLAGDRSAFRPGETLKVSALWALGAAPASLEARLFWRTTGKGTEDLVIVAQQEVATPAAAGEGSFEFTLPEAPWSFSGKLISLLWAVELVAEPDGQSARCEFVLGPHAKEILLTAPADASRA